VDVRSSRPPTARWRSWRSAGNSAPTSTNRLAVIEIELPPLRERRETCLR
jgi:transcriptional regulator with AAA-type ATPase domain